ncbi:MAG TPA: iron-containing alcohol dehydrogenase [Draconibacterium sp.]|nr:iron-containing alcohol dehydrogenase [Draconibacterium sp.]
MGLNFEFATASRIIFGNHVSDKLPELLAGMGKRVLLVTGKNSARHQPFIDLLTGADFKVTLYQIPSEPTIEIIDAGVNAARKNQCQIVVGIGGGSVIDGAKAIAAMVPNPGELLDYLEVIGRGKALSQAPLPCVAVPTTSGTGAEVTKNSVIKSTQHNVKVSLRSNLMYPDVALVDPVLTVSLPKDITATTGTDALTHLLETFVSNQANPFIDMYCREGMKRISRSLVKAFNDGSDLEARENMSIASMLGGMALANVKLGAVHGFAGPMGGMFPVPHGAVCACLLPAVMEMNIQVLTGQKMEEKLFKYHEVAKILTGTDNATVTDGILWVNEMVRVLEIPSLSEFGVTQVHFTELVEKAKDASSMKGNPVLLSSEQLTTILEMSL